MAHISRCHKAPLATTAILHSRTLTTRATARILWSFLQPEVQALHPTVAWPELFSYTHFFLTYRLQVSFTSPDGCSAGLAAGGLGISAVGTCTAKDLDRRMIRTTQGHNGSQQVSASYLV